MWQKRKNFYLETTMLNYGWLNIYTVAKNGNMRQPEIRTKFLKNLGLSEKSIITLEQVHGNKIVVVKDKLNNQPETIFAKSDGIVIKSAKTNPALIVFTADCLSIAAISPKTGEYGIVHAGWRGLKKKILTSFGKNFSRPADLIVAIGPHIHKCCYPVSPEIGKKFGKYFRKGLLDLTSVARKQISRWQGKKIIVHPDCTGHQKKFFSYRRQHTAARQMNYLVRLTSQELKKWIN